MHAPPHPPRPEPTGILSGAHNPLLVILFFLGGMVGVGAAVFSALYDVDPTWPLDQQERMIDAARTVLMFSFAGCVVSALSAFVMRKPAVGLAILLLPPLAAGGLFGYRWKAVHERLAAAETQRLKAEARVEAMAKVRAHFADYCAIPHADPRARKPGKKHKGRPNIVAITDDGRIEYALTTFETTAVSKVDLVVCLNRREVAHQTCLYELGGTLQRKSFPVDLTVYRAASGQEVLRKTLEPREPLAPCPGAITDNRSGSSIDRTVEPKDLIDAVKPLVKSSRRRRK